MTIRIDENIIAIWYCDLGPGEDYMMGVSRCDAGIKFAYRVRHHSPDSKDPFDGKDVKNWNEFYAIDRDEEKAIDAAREMVKGLVGLAVGLKRITLPHKIYELVRGDATLEEFADKLTKAPFAHVQRKTIQ